MFRKKPVFIDRFGYRETKAAEENGNESVVELGILNTLWGRFSIYPPVLVPQIRSK